MTRRWRASALFAAWLAGFGALTACSTVAADSASSDRGQTRHTSSCGPLRPSDVAGPVPRHAVGEELDFFPGAGLVCRGLWLDSDDFVPQGLVVEQGTAWVAGYPGRAEVGSRFCRVLRVDLRSGRVLAERDAVQSQDGLRCRHAGGLASDSHGLWLVETHRVWLLDPITLEPRRTWELTAPVTGSTGTIRRRASGAELGLGQFRVQGRARAFWFDVERLLQPGATRLAPSDAVRVHAVPLNLQGLAWDDGLLTARSVTRCGVLGRAGRAYGFVPGAEGIAVDGPWLWVASESGSRKYYTQGGRPLVPNLVALQKRHLVDLPTNSACLQ